MTDNLKQRVLNAVNRAMSYCLKGFNSQPVVVLLGTDKIVPTDELYDTIVHLRSMLLNKDEAGELRKLVYNECLVHKQMINSYSNTLAETKQFNEKRLAKLTPILDKLEVLCGQA